MKKNENIKWFFHYIFPLILIVVVCLSWIWIPAAKDYVTFRQFSRELSSLSLEESVRAGVSDTLLSVEGKSPFPSVDLTMEESEHIANILAQAQHLQMTQEKEHLPDQRVIIADLPNGYWIDVFPDFCLISNRIYAVCDNNEEIYHELAAYLLSLDSDRFQGDLSYPGIIPNKS
ncbi:MAG: hypothetical protein Q4P20_06210 [Eubacteriales bacterium]|nr:hypothetical protein [Eubacteriales bacterium]